MRPARGPGPRREVYNSLVLRSTVFNTPNAALGLPAGLIGSMAIAQPAGVGFTGEIGFSPVAGATPIQLVPLKRNQAYHIRRYSFTAADLADTGKLVLLRGAISVTVIDAGGTIKYELATYADNEQQGSVVLSLARRGFVLIDDWYEWDDFAALGSPLNLFIFTGLEVNNTDAVAHNLNVYESLEYEIWENTSPFKQPRP